MIRFLTRPLFLLLTALFLANQLIEHFGIVVPFVHAYLDDFLTLPLGLSFVLFVQRFLVYRDGRYSLPVWQIVFAWVVFSVWFELILPQYKATSVANVWDVVAYAAGGLVFYRRMNQPQLVRTSA